MEEWLVSFDTDRIHQYVFTPDRMREIRGASALLDFLNRNESKTLIEVKRGRVIYCAGGSGMAVFSDESAANDFCDSLEEKYRCSTLSASISTAVVPKKSYEETLKMVSAQLKHKKNFGKPMALPLNEPLWVRCQRCGMYPGINFHKFPEGDLIICQSCQAKVDQTLSQNNNSAVARFCKKNQSIITPESFTYELNKLAESSRPENYLGVVYADGNGIGNTILRCLKSYEEITEFSSLLETALMNALVKSSQPYLETDTQKILPIIIGGDDILLITTADIAVSLANDLCLNFQSIVTESCKNSKKPNIQSLQISMSAGVVIAKNGHPLSFLVDLTEELLRSAKNLSKDMELSGLGSQCTLDFSVIKTPVADPLNNIRMREFEIDQNKYASCRPYPCKDIEGLKRPSIQSLLDAGISLQKFPRNKLTQWQQLLYIKSADQQDLNLKMMHKRLGNQQSLDLNRALKRLSMEPGQLYLPDPINTSREISPLADLEEIFEFIK